VCKKHLTSAVLTENINFISERVEWATVEKVLRTVDVTRVGNLGYSVILRRYINW